MREKGFSVLRRMLIAILDNAGLFLFVSFFHAAVLSIEPLRWYNEQIQMFSQYILQSWGISLVVLRLSRRNRLGENALIQTDILVLNLLVLWIIVPFGIRFGLTANNVSAWYGYLVMYLGVYATITELPSAARRRMLRGISALFVLLALCMGIVLLYCAYTGTVLGADVGGMVIGVQDGILYGGVHYNITGMVALGCMMLSLVSMNAERNPLFKVVGLAAAGIMAVVIVLTQSRTARYAMLIALAVGCYGALAARFSDRKAILRHGLAVLCACLVLGGGYAGASKLTDLALEHYMGLNGGTQGVLQSVVSSAAAEEVPEADATETAVTPEAETPAPAQAPQGEPLALDAAETEEAQATAAPEPLEAREAVDSSFSGRTEIWISLARLWAENPKYLFIGNGVGRTGSQVVVGTMHEALGGVSIHNTYLQYIADFGLIGFGMQVAFLVLVLRKAVCVFFAAGRRTCPGGRALCMVVVACLATGMMESAPLGGMTPMNLVLYFALAQLMAMGRDLERKDVHV